MGVITRYTYDGAGRLISTRKGDHRTTLSYDALGRQHKTSEWIDSTTARVTTREYDLLNRITEERLEEYSLESLSQNLISLSRYGYDRYGNRCSILEGNNLTQITHDSRHRPIQIVDALGHKTIIEYEEAPNLTITETDPLGRQTITRHDALGRVIEVQRKDILRQVCAQSKRLYDLAGHLIRQEDTVIAPQLPSHQVVTSWHYDSMGRVTLLTEALGTPEQKHTSYGYNLYGQKESITLPDGTILSHRYDSLGRLESYFSSDGTIHYTYSYDNNHNLLSVIDRCSDTITLRTYDAYNQLTSELLANGLELQYTYDNLGRLIEVDLPDKTGIDYSYDAAYLRKVKRRSITSYEHLYSRYDLSGNLLEETTPCGQISYQWTALNQPKAIRSEPFTETIESYDAVGNLLQKTRAEKQCHYTYDSLDQLQSESLSDFVKHDYLYDSLYNRRQKDGQEHTINSLNQLLSQGGTRYTYDRKGNLVEEQSPTTQASYTYDALNRLTSLTRDGERYEYQYDAFNRRIQKITPESTERYLYIDQNEIGVMNEQGEIAQLRILGLGKGAEIGSAIALSLMGKPTFPTTITPATSLRWST